MLCLLRNARWRRKHEHPKRQIRAWVPPYIRSESSSSRRHAEKCWIGKVVDCKRLCCSRAITYSRYETEMSLHYGCGSVTGNVAMRASMAAREAPPK